MIMIVKVTSKNSPALKKLLERCKDPFLDANDVRKILRDLIKTIMDNNEKN